MVNREAEEEQAEDGQRYGEGEERCWWKGQEEEIDALTTWRCGRWKHQRSPLSLARLTVSTAVPRPLTGGFKRCVVNDTGGHDVRRAAAYSLLDLATEPNILLPTSSSLLAGSGL